MATGARGGGSRRWGRRLGDAVNHDDVLVRFAALWTLCAALFAVSWILSYHVLPEGILRRTGLPGPTSAAAASVGREFVTIFAWNLGFGLLVVLSNTFRSVRTPMGYLVVLVAWIRGAVVWGTNSLAIPAGRLEPSLSVVLERSGAFELTAFVAIAVATRGVLLWHQESPPRHREPFERVGHPREWSIDRREALVLAAGVLLLALANYREASMIVEVAG